MEYEKLMQEAWNKNKDFDDTEIKNGYKAVAQMSPIEILNIAISSIKEGIKYNEFQTIAEGQAMLYELRIRLGLGKYREDEVWMKK